MPLIPAFVLVISFILRAVYIFLPSTPWWDTSIYIGMGKSLFTGGTLGLWESFRPVFWPVILGFFWKVGISPSFAGKVLEVLFATGLIYLVYKIGEMSRKNMGVYAAVLLGFSPVFFYFTAIPLTDIPSAFFIVLAIYLLLKNKYFWAGLAASIAFGFRFPQALIIIPLFIALCVMLWDNKRGLFKKTILLGLGFSVVIIPYLFVSWRLYGNPLHPILTGNQVFDASPGHEPWHMYFSGVFMQNPFIILAIWFIVDLFRTRGKMLKNGVYISILSAAFTILIYFSSKAHKELRYAIAALPFLALMAGYGFAILSEKFAFFKIKYIVPLIMVVLAIIGISSVRQWYSPEEDAYYSFFRDKAGAQVIATAPQVIADNDVRIVQVAATWEEMSDVMSRQREKVDYITLSTCQLACASGDCENSRRKVEEKLATYPQVFKMNLGQCLLTIYKEK